MAPRDRTAELHSIVDRMRSSQGAAARPAARITGGASALSPAAQRFAEAAQGFSKELAATSLSLANLTKLIQQQSVFDDQAPEIASLTAIVKTKLSKMHDDLSLLAELRQDAAIGPSSTQGNRHTEAVITTLRTRLVSTSQDFKTILQRRTKTIRETHARRDKLSSDKPATFESALFRQQQQYGNTASDERDADSNGAGGGRLAQEQSLTHNNSQYFKSRYDAVRQLEAAVHEVGEMFQDFSRLVDEQDVTIVRIDTEVEESLGYVTAGSGELMKYLASLSSNRGMILKIFAVLFFFVLFFGFFVVR